MPLMLLLGTARCRVQPAVAAAAAAAACSCALQHATDWDCCSRCTLTCVATACCCRWLLGLANRAEGINGTRD
eukprot:5043125-Alexandrium_andersonii.AAC.1